MASPICTVNGSATTDGVDVSASGTVTIALADTTGVRSWTIECISTDELNTAAGINAGLSVNTTNKTATFTSPAAGGTCIFRSTINSGVDVNGNDRPDYVTTFGVYVLASSGNRVLAVNETTEGDSEFGWIATLNPLLRSSSGGGGGSLPSGTGTVRVDSGTASAPDYVKFGTNPASSGYVRAPYNQNVIGIRNQANDANIPVVKVGPDDVLEFGSGDAVTQVSSLDLRLASYAGVGYWLDQDKTNRFGDPFESADFAGETYPIAGYSSMFSYRDGSPNYFSVHASDANYSGRIIVANAETENGLMMMSVGSTATEFSSLFQGDNVLMSVGDSNADLKFAKADVDGTNAAVLGQIKKTGQWLFGSTTVTAGLTGPMLSLGSASGTLTNTAGQAVIYNSSGNLNLQGASTVNFLVGTATAGYFDASARFRIGASNGSSATIMGATIPDISSTTALYSYNASAENDHYFISGSSSGYASLYVMNSAANGAGFQLFAMGSTGAGITGWASGAVIEQMGPSTSALVFSTINNSGTGRATTGRIFRSGAWCIGSDGNNDTSAGAQCGLDGALINLANYNASGHTLPSAQSAIIYNSEGNLDLVGGEGTRLWASSTLVVAVNSLGTAFNKAVTFNPTAVSYAATINVDLSSGSVFDVTLTGNATINFTNLSNGMIGYFRVKQDGTGGRTVTWGSEVVHQSGPEATVSPTAGNTTVYPFVCSATKVVMDWSMRHS
jgi:hypothetical protein